MYIVNTSFFYFIFLCLNIVSSSGGDSSKSFQESPFLLNELKLTKKALKHEVNQRAMLEKNYCAELFSQLKPLPVRLMWINIFKHNKCFCTVNVYYKMNICKN